MTTTTQKSKIISLRDLYRDAGSIAERATRGEHFEVFKHSRPVMHISPPKSVQQKELSAHDVFGGITFSKIKGALPRKDKDLSEQIDDILYAS